MMTGHTGGSESGTPSREQGLQRLHTLSTVIGQYASARNHTGESTTTRLSPYIRRRLILEDEVLEFARAVGSFSKVEKFAQEVVWRTYWKGWLANRPGVWIAYLDRLQALDQTLAASDRDRLDCALRGQTDLPFLNAWCEELISTGYLHNHVRMWFASIWIFTLKLPWELGARFFLDHLLDGDPAANTLSWRWVAGLQTAGKHYVARADNIAKYTDGRWVPKPGQLNESAKPLPDDGLSRTPAKQPSLGPLAETVRPQAVLLHNEDCGPLPAAWCGVPAVRHAVTDHRQHVPSALVTDWIAGACADADARFGAVTQTRSADELAAWCRDAGVAELWTWRPHTGFVANALAGLRTSLAPRGISLQYADRHHDLLFFSLANRGFFPFWERASAKLRQLWQ
jgi:deoxyribodipyrimidine photo-lyase